MDAGKNIYGLSEGVFKACQFLGLKFPTTVPKELDPFEDRAPSDYFGDDFELDATTIKKMRSVCNLTEEKFQKRYKIFYAKFASQNPLKQTKTDRNVFFCDYVLHSAKFGNFTSDYFDFEFYGKSFALRSEFLTQKHRNLIRIICNDPCDINLLNNKAETNRIFSAFLHRDWINTDKCTFDDFKAFVEKHSRFFSKSIVESSKVGSEIIAANSKTNLEKLFANLQRKKMLLEEVVVQHEALAAFCPDILNTIRVNTFLDAHNGVHILTAVGRFGVKGSVAGNFNDENLCVTIDTKTGEIISDAINQKHERFQTHPDTGKSFKGFQYPSWKEVRATVKKLSKMIPTLRHVGWDIAINDKSEIVIIAAKENPDVDIQQAPDGVGRLHLYQPLLDEMLNYKREQMKLLGYRVNNLRNFDSSYDPGISRLERRLQFAMIKLLSDCTSLMDLGCRKDKFVKTLCPEDVKYYPVDFKAYDDEIIACDFNKDFPEIKVDTCLCALTAEYVKSLPYFLTNMCNAAQKQILMLCCPINDNEMLSLQRWKNPFLTDFTEEFLIQTMEQNNFRLDKQYPTDNKSVILYDFRKILE